jgi:hypothetical protein
MELGIPSSSLTSINVPVLDSGIKQTRIVTKSCWLARDQAWCQVQTNVARDSHLYLLLRIILQYTRLLGYTIFQAILQRSDVYCLRSAQ